MALDLPILADDVVGIELLSYLVSATEDVTNERVTGANEMSEVQEGVLAELCELFAADAGPRNVFDHLFPYDDDASMSAANVLHCRTGGNVDLPCGLDAVADAVARIASDIFPALLLRQPLMDSIRRSLDGLQGAVGAAGLGFTIQQDPFLPARPQIEGWLFTLTLRHPAFADFMTAAEADTEIRALLPRAGEVRQGALAASNGGAQTVQLPSVPWMLVSAASFRFRALHEFHGRAVFVDEALAGLDQLRKIGRGEQLTIPALAGFSGVHLPVGARIQTPWGIVRSRTEFDADLLPPTAEATAVLQTEAPLAFSVHAELDDEMNLFPPDPFVEIERKQTLAALALMLGTSPATLRQREPGSSSFRPFTRSPGNGDGRRPLRLQSGNKSHVRSGGRFRKLGTASCEVPPSFNRHRRSALALSSYEPARSNRWLHRRNHFVGEPLW